MRLPLAASLLAILALNAHAETFTVTRTDDSSNDCLPDDCTLRSAMTAAGANDPAGETDVIVLPAGTYSLRLDEALPVVHQPLRILGAGSGQTLLETEHRTLFNVGDGGDLALSGIRFDAPFGGDGPGGSFAFEATEGSHATLDVVITERGTVYLHPQSSVQIRRSELRHYLHASGELLIEDSTLFNLLMYFQAEQASATLRRVVVDEAAAIDIAVADAVLQRDAPLPARLASDGQGVRRRRRVAGALHGDGAVAGQPARPVLIAGLQRLLDQQAAKAAAIYEEVAVDARAVLQIEALDEAGFGMQRDVRHPAFDAAHAARLGEAA